MGLWRFCPRCGGGYLTDTEVCPNCKSKDEADVLKLKGFFEETYIAGQTVRQDVLNNTGISSRNLDRYMTYSEFAGIKFGSPEEKIIKSKK